jgi:HK97 family phage portal protein
MPGAYVYTVNGQKRTISVEQHSGLSPILHLKMFHPLHDWYGLSPLEAAASAIDQHNAVGSHNLSLLQNGGRPSGAVLFKQGDKMISEDQRDLLRSDIQALYEGVTNAGRILILEGDMDWKEMGLSPKDLDFMTGKNISAREIAQAYGVPPMLIGVTGDSTFANYREARLHLWEDTVLPLLDKIIAEMNRWLSAVHRENLRFAYDMDSIPALSLKREAVWARVQNADFLTTDEKREAVGYSPRGEG